MNILKKVRNKLAIEFLMIRPDIIDAVIWMISGGFEKKSFQQVSDEIVGRE